MKLFAVFLIVFSNFILLIAQQSSYQVFKPEYLRTRIAPTVRLRSSDFKSEINLQKNRSILFSLKAPNQNFKQFDLYQIQSCPGSISLPFLPLGGLFMGYVAYDSYKSGNKKDGNIALCASTVLIVVPISYLIYCSKHKFSFNKNPYQTKKRWI